METRKKWGGSFLAVIFALLMIGGASFYYFQNQPAKDASRLGEGNLGDWQKVSSTALNASSNLNTSESLSTDLYNNYLDLAQSGTFTALERDAMLADLAKRHITTPAIVPIINLADLNASNTASLDVYVKLFAVIMSQASLVKKYEVAVFTESVTAGNIHGTPALQETAELYKRIAASLLVMEVPVKLAPQHLEAVKSVGALAKAVENMANWKGDPIQALTDVDTFNKAQVYVTNSMDTLAVAIVTLQKKT
ncbi:MAG: hypothetical protein V4449_00695 [Patescibacteria group bacterium]